jgi:hypothetical protein
VQIGDLIRSKKEVGGAIRTPGVIVAIKKLRHGHSFLRIHWQTGKPGGLFSDEVETISASR